jgi:hypothetical protein
MRAVLVLIGAPVSLISPTNKINLTNQSLINQSQNLSIKKSKSKSIDEQKQPLFNLLWLQSTN